MEARVTSVKRLLIDEECCFEECLHAKLRTGEHRHFIFGVVASAELFFSTGTGNCGIIGPKIESPGLWGIEVTSPEDPYLDEVYEEELKTLSEMLATLGLALPS